MLPVVPQNPLFQIFGNQYEFMHGFLGSKKIYLYIIKILFIIIVLFYPSWSFATTIIQMRLTDLISYSGWIIEGTVREKINNPGDEMEISYINYSVCDLNVIWGDVQERCISIDSPGGVNYKNQVEEFVGMPILEVGRRYILFLTYQPAYDSPFIGWHQGVYPVLQDSSQEVVVSYFGNPLISIREDDHFDWGTDIYGFESIQINSSSKVIVNHIHGEPRTEINQILNQSMSKAEFLFQIYERFQYFKYLEKGYSKPSLRKFRRYSSVLMEEN